MRKFVVIFLPLALLAVACDTARSVDGGPPPVLYQLGKACDTAAVAYNTAAAYRAQGKLSRTAINALMEMQPALRAMCNKSNPPADLQLALNSVLEWLEVLTLANAGVQARTGILL